jgi:hypothetical protein
MMGQAPRPGPAAVRWVSEQERKAKRLLARPRLSTDPNPSVTCSNGRGRSAMTTNSGGPWEPGLSRRCPECPQTWNAEKMGSEVIRNRSP